MSPLQWQLAGDAAQRYDAVLVPSFLGMAALAVVNRVAPAPGECVVDVGCGTGAAARIARDRVGPTGRVIGFDVNRFMLKVARAAAVGPADGTAHGLAHDPAQDPAQDLAHDPAHEPADDSAEIEYREGDARQLPLRDRWADALVCSNTLQFVPEKSVAVGQMARVLRPGGRLAIGVWEELAHNPYFEVLSTAIAAVMGSQVAQAVASACSLGAAADLWSLVSAGPFQDVKVETIQLDVALGPLGDFIPRHIGATPMAAAFRAAGEDAVQEVVNRATFALGPPLSEGTAQMPFRLLIGSAVA